MCLFNPSSSFTKETETSKREIEEVMAARKSAKKKRSCSMEPNGICWNISGSTTNTSPGPSEGAMPNAKTAGIMARPERRAKAVSEIDVSIEVFIMLSFLLT